MPCLPLASAAPAGAAATGSPGDNTGCCLAGTAEPKGLPWVPHTQPRAHRGASPAPVPAPAQAGAPATAAGLGGRAERQGGLCPSSSCTPGRAWQSAGTAATGRARKPCTLPAPPHLHSLFGFIVRFPLIQVHTGWFPCSQGEAREFFFPQVISPTVTRGIGLYKY